MFAVSPFPAFHHRTMDIGNDGVGVYNVVLEFRNTLMNVRNDCPGVRDVTSDVGDDYVRIYCEFGLEATS